MNEKIGQLNQALSTAVLRVMKALARVLLRHGVPFQVFEELAKRAYVEVAQREFAIPGRKQTSSRVAVITGLTRKDIQRLSDAVPLTDQDSIDRHNRAARVIAGWVRDPAFQDSGSEPLELAFDGTDPNFAELVRRYSGDMPPRAVLDELLRVGSVQRLDNGKLKLNSRVYIPQASDAQKLLILGTDVADLIYTIDHNLMQHANGPRLQRKVMYDNLPHESMEEIRALCRTRAQTLIEDLDVQISRHDRDANAQVHGTGRARAGVGIYYFEDDLNGTQ